MIQNLQESSASSRPWLRKQHAAGLLLLCFAAAANAHSGEGITGGFVSGFLHPLSGIDHLLAMVAVGIWGATLGRPLVWALPVAFPMLMVVGGVLGIAKVPLPYIEIGIAVSFARDIHCVARAFQAARQEILDFLLVFNH